MPSQIYIYIYYEVFKALKSYFIQLPTQFIPLECLFHSYLSQLIWNSSQGSVAIPPLPRWRPLLAHAPFLGLQMLFQPRAFALTVSSLWNRCCRQPHGCVSCLLLLLAQKSISQRPSLCYFQLYPIHTHFLPTHPCLCFNFAFTAPPSPLNVSTMMSTLPVLLSFRPSVQDMSSYIVGVY